jgi:hypothetical protein
MAVELSETPISAYTDKRGGTEVELSAGQWVRIQHGPSGDPVDDLLEQVPAGKAWSVRFFVAITETDA